MLDYQTGWCFPPIRYRPPQKRHQGTMTCDMRTTRRALSSLPRRSKRRKVGEMGRPSAKSSNQLVHTTRKSILRSSVVCWNVEVCKLWTGWTWKFRRLAMKTWQNPEGVGSVGPMLAIFAAWLCSVSTMPIVYPCQTFHIIISCSNHSKIIGPIWKPPQLWTTALVQAHAPFQVANWSNTWRRQFESWSNESTSLARLVMHHLAVEKLVAEFVFMVEMLSLMLLTRTCTRSLMQFARCLCICTWKCNKRTGFYAV